LLEAILNDVGFEVTGGRYSKSQVYRQAPPLQIRVAEDRAVLAGREGAH
jgi:hypothetical protein